MSIQDKITSKEKAVRDEIDNLKSVLNKLSVIGKSNPNDWRYISALSTAENELKRLNQQMREIHGNI